MDKQSCIKEQNMEENVNVAPIDGKMTENIYTKSATKYVS